MNDDVAQHDRSSRGWPLDAGRVWEVRHWHLGAVVHRMGEWVRASRRRHRTVVIIGIILGLTIIPGCVGAVAMAQSDSPGASGGNGALSWMNVRDSAGVSLSKYTFAFNNDAVGILHPFNTAMATAISLEFAGWMVIVVTGIWLIGFVLSFRWMDLFATPLRAIAAGFTEQISIPIVLITAASIGAFCVAWFVLRGFHAKAVTQVVTMLGVAVLGPMFLANPLADVLSSDGWLSQGRDLGITVAAGLNGDRNPRPNAIVASMQEQLADNFARKPLQVWNFGHVIDDRPACGAAWTNSVATGDDNRIKNAMRSCGDGAAYDAAKEPTAGQFGAGLLVLISGTLMLAFGAVLAVKIVRAALDSVYYSFLAIFGFAAGGFVYGPTQTFLVRSVVHAFFAAVRMAVMVIFLGVYVLFLGDIFRQAQGQVMAVFVMGAILEIVAISQLKHLDASLSRGNDWVANRFALTLHGAPVKSAGGGTALGMGTVGAQRHGFGVIKTLGAVSLVAGSPYTAALLRRRDGTLPDQAIVRVLQNFGLAPGGGSRGWAIQAALNRPQYANAALEAAEAAGGIDTVLGAAAGIHAATASGASVGDLRGALFGARFDDVPLVERAIASWGASGTSRDDHLNRTINAMHRVRATSRRLEQTGHTPEGAAELATDMAILQIAAAAFRGGGLDPVVLDGGRATGRERRFVESYMADGTATRLSSLGKLASGEQLAAPVPGVGGNPGSPGDPHYDELRGITPVQAQRMWSWIGREFTENVANSVEELGTDPQDRARMRLANRHIAAAQAAAKATPYHRATPWTQLNS